MAGPADALRDPLPLAPNRIPRFYHGGRLLDEFRGEPAPRDDHRPEDWVGSATRAWQAPGRPSQPLGLSTVELAGRHLTLEAALAEAPEALVGRAMLERAGPILGLLVKLLDAGERLPVHCHPTRAAAARLLASPFGKTEAWLILGTRERATPRIWAGFREEVDPRTLRGWIDRQETDPLLAALIEHPVGAGDAFLIPAGTPHAIGAGVFMLEVQEPTDFSVVAEMRGFPISADDASLGLGWETAIEFFVTDASDDLRQSPAPVADGMMRLLGPAADPFFRMLRMEVSGERGLDLEPSFAVAVVLGGAGEARGAERSLILRRGSTFAVPAAAMAELRIAGTGLDLVLAVPPVAELAPER